MGGYAYMDDVSDRPCRCQVHELGFGDATPEV